MKDLKDKGVLYWVDIAEFAICQLKKAIEESIENETSRIGLKGKVDKMRELVESIEEDCVYFTKEVRKWN